MLCPKKHPILKKRILSLSEIIEDRAGIYNTADNAGEKIIEEVRHPGNELMHIWASEKESAGVEAVKKVSENITGHGKKTVMAYDIRRNNGSGEGIHKKRTSYPPVFGML